MSELLEEIQQLEKELEQVNQKKKKIHLVSDQVGGWANRVMVKMSDQNIADDNILGPGKKKSILQLFQTITDVVSHQLTEIVNFRAQDNESQNMYISAKDFMNDFATDEFITKNIRVRPYSGATAGKQDDERQSEHYSRNNFGGGMPGGGVDQTDEEEKFNKMVNLEMDDQRKKIKVRKEEAEKKKEVEIEKLNKQNQKNGGKQK